MVRPRADRVGPSAQERLESAYWMLLDRRGFEGVTVAALCERAGVNRNTFYYYFTNLEDMAQQLFDRNLMPRLAAGMLVVMRSGGVDLASIVTDAEVRTHFARVLLYARPDSALLGSILVDSLQRLWLDAVGVSQQDLSQADRDRLAFLFGGLVFSLGRMGNDASPARISALLDSPFGRGIFHTLTTLPHTVGRNQTKAPRSSV